MMIEEVNKKPVLLIACTHSFGAKFLEGQLDFMKRSGFDVVVLSAPGIEIENLCLRENARLIPFAFRRDISFISDIKSLLKISRILKKLKPDVVNAGTPKAGLLVCLAAKVIGLRSVIFTLRGLRSDTLKGGKKLLVKSMETFTCRLADVVIPVGPSLSDHAQKEGILPSRKALVLGAGSSNGINVNKFRRRMLETERDALRASLGIEKSDFVISYIGRINNDKGIFELFKAFSKLSLQERGVKLLIVGKFESEDAIPLVIRNEMESHPNVILASYRDDVKSIYEIVDTIVLYSKREGFSNILIEASSMEVPVIASSIPGCRDAVNDGISGYLVNNEEELFLKLLYYATNQNVAKSHGLAGRHWVKEKFESHVIWNEQLDLYRKMVNR